MQQRNPANSSQTESDFFFVMDLCEHFANYTGIEDCKSINESLAVLDQIKVEAKVAHEFFNVKTYVMNGYEMNTEFITYQMTLNKNAF